MTSELNEALQDIREIVGVENVVLIQQDGLPVASAGVWFSRDEVFSVASATCAIFGVARLVHGAFKYLLMETDTSKIFLASLPKNPHFFLTVTTAPRVNLAALFMEMKQNLSRITFLLQEHLEGRRPPLRSYSPDDTREVLSGFSVTDGIVAHNPTSYPILSLDRAHALGLRNILQQISDTIPGTHSAFFALNGGIRISLTGFTDDRFAAMSFALHGASERVVRTLRNASLQRVLCEAERGRHFLYSVPNGVFSLWVGHTNQKLGLIRLLLRHYLAEASQVLESLSRASTSIPEDLRELLMSGIAEPRLVLGGND